MSIKVGDIYTMRNGRKVRVIATDREDDWPIVCLCQDPKGKWSLVREYSVTGYCIPPTCSLIDIPRILNICAGGLYRTRDGHTVKVVCTDRPSDFPVIAYVMGGSEEGTLRFYLLDGKIDTSIESPVDLVEVV